MMTYRQLKWASIFLIGFSNIIAAGQSFAPPLDKVHWFHEGNRMQCRLYFPVRNFGEFEIRHVHAETPQVYVTSWQPIPDGVPAQIYAMTTDWSDKKKPRLLSKGVWQLKERTVLHLDTSGALQIMSQLQQGFKVRLKYKNVAKQPVYVDLLPVNFTQAYDDYVNCSKDLARVKFHKVKDNTIYFESDGISLSERALSKLKLIAHYAASDPGIIKIKIDGYSDNVGGRANNIFLSEKRAKRAHEFLLEHGVAKEKFKLNWHGSRYPAVVNDTEKGRATNRRVRIRLVR